MCGAHATQTCVRGDHTHNVACQKSDGRARWAAELYEDEVDATEVDMQHVGVDEQHDEEEEIEAHPLTAWLPP